ncbi:MAG: hypothetical protein HY897_11715 [Deltaproteobacteria bacterium]|nr:hypothetical protein [Deltaproteobacteria bacterium]
MGRREAVMLDAFIIEKIREEEDRRREDRRPRLQIPVFVDEDCGKVLPSEEDPGAGERKDKTSEIEY